MEKKFEITRIGDYGDKLYEFKLPIMKIDEILTDVPQSNDKIHKSVLQSYYKTYNDYIDVVDKKRHMFKINDLSGKIMNNNRVIIEVIIFDKNELEKIKENIVEFSVGEFYTQMPNSIDVFGIQMKPISFLDRDSLKQVFEQNISYEMAVEVISNVTGYTYEKKFNDFYIWTKK